MNRIISASVIVLVCAAGTVSALRLNVSNDIAAFLPRGDTDPRASLARTLSNSALTRRITYLIGGPDAATAIDAAHRFAATLETDDAVERVQTGPRENSDSDVFAMYENRAPFSFCALPPCGQPRAPTNEELDAMFTRLKDALQGPLSSVARNLAPSDPSLAFFERMHALSRMRPSQLHLRDNTFLTEDERHAVVFLTTRESAFNAAAQAPFLERAAAAFRAVNAAHDGSLTFGISSMARFAVAAESSVRADLARISILSSIGVVLFTLLLFRSVRILLLTAVPVAFGMAVSFLVTYLVFGSVHGITLAFGCSLIGVTEDYPVHLLNHHMFAGEGAPPANSVKRVWPGLLLGGATTALGLLGFAWTSLQGMREIAVFASSGVVGALFATRVLLPPFMGHAAPTPTQARAAIYLDRILRALRQRRPVLLSVWVVAFGVAAVGLPQLRWNDDLSRLNELNDSWRTEDARVKSLVGAPEATRWIAAIGRNDEEALRTNDRVGRALAAAKVAHEVGWHAGVDGILASNATQQAHADVLRDDETFLARFQQAALRNGFEPDAFSPFTRIVAHPARSPLSPQDVFESPLAEIVNALRIPVGDRVAYLTLLRDVRDTAQLARRVSSVPNAVYFDQKEVLTNAYGAFRARTLEVLSVGLLAVLLVAAVRYRKPRAILAVCLPAWTAALATFGILGLLHIEANLMHLLSLVLVLSMGIDYGIFMAEHRHGNELPSTLLAVVTASITTILSFGLLAFSSQPALRSLGIGIGIGMTLSMLLAPLAVLVLRSDEDATT